MTSGARRKLYRWARFLGDVEAASQGPEAYGRRVVRRTVYRHVNRATGHVLRKLGLQ